MIVDIDPEMLISLVKQTPVLWDRNQEDYKCRASTRDAWRRICAKLMPNFNNNSEVYRENYEKSLMKKWRNIKDNYIKSHKKWRRTNRKKYIFHKHLTFLDGTLEVHEMKTTWSSDIGESRLPDPLSALEDTREDVNAGSCADMKPNISFIVTKVEKRDISEECMLPDSLSSSAAYVEENPYGDSFSNEPRDSVPKPNSDTEITNHTSGEENRHMLFFKSVLPSLKDFTDDDTLALQAAVICAIRDIKRECAHSVKSGCSQ